MQKYNFCRLYNYCLYNYYNNKCKRKKYFAYIWCARHIYYFTIVLSGGCRWWLDGGASRQHMRTKTWQQLLRLCARSWLSKASRKMAETRNPPVFSPKTLYQLSVLAIANKFLNLRKYLPDLPNDVLFDVYYQVNVKLCCRLERFFTQ